MAADDLAGAGLQLDLVLAIRKFLDSVILPWVRLFRFIPPVRAGAMMFDLSSIVAFIVFLIGSNLIIDIPFKGAA